MELVDCAQISAGGDIPEAQFAHLFLFEFVCLEEDFLPQ